MSNKDDNVLLATNYIRQENGEYFLSGLKCKGCNSIFLEDRSSCGKCFARDCFVELKLANTGKLYSYSIVHRSFPGVDVPYVSAIVDLDGGGTVKGNLVDVDLDPQNISFDMKVKIIFKDALGRKDKDGNSYISFFFAPI
ncbi:OB-fold domain-containing protein [Gammaproteobacteria bacterium]|nr:OB-fold domain-containing protein [Gammaproteobacteria bacterium]